MITIFDNFYNGLTVKWSEMMELSIVEMVTYGTLVVSVLFCVFLTILKVFKRVRHAIPSNINCWFCNTNSKVLYTSRNSWTCPNCQQYNGFNEDGGYNKRLPSQYIESLNRPIRGNAGIEEVHRDVNNLSLCERCNVNQELKYFQLAQFVPSVEEKYDEEVEAEQRRLDQVYDICSHCKNTVRQALKQNKSKVSRGQNSVSPSSSTSNSQKSQLVERPSRPVTPALIPQHCNNTRTPKDANIGSGQFSPLASNNNDENESFGVKLTKLSIGSSCRPRSNTNSLFGESISSGNLKLNPSPLSRTLTSPQGYSHGVSAESLGRLTFNNWPKPQQNFSKGPYSLYPYDNMYQTSGTPCCNFSTYQYRSSSMATVFGGRKPLLSPSRLSTSINSQGRTTMYVNHVCNCQPPYNAYGMVNGSNMAFSSPPSIVSSPSIVSPPYYYSQPLSRSSSQSSGFGSQGQYHDGSCNSTPTPPSAFSSPNPQFISQQQQQQPGVFTNNAPPSQASMMSSFQPITTQKRNGKDVSQKRGILSRGETVARSCPARRTIKKEVEEDDNEVIFSDDDEDFSSSKVSTIRQRKGKNILRSKPDNKSDKNSNIKHISNNKTNNLLCFLCQMFLRFFLFVNVVLLFCVFFVGQWPEPMSHLVDKVSEIYGDLFNTILPGLLYFESCVNKMLTYVYPDGTEIQDNETITSELFEGFEL